MRLRLPSGWIGSILLSAWLFCGVFAVFSLVSTLGAPQAAAQEEGAGGADAAATTDAPAPARDNYLVWLWRTLTWRYSLMFLFISFNLIALMVMNILSTRRDSIVPQALIDGFEALLGEKRYQEAYELARQDESMLGRVLAAGMSKLSAGYDEASAAMQEAGEEENMKLEQRLSYIALCAQIGPMFGLLGTVDGMVVAFDVIAQSNITPKPSELAQGIGTALVTTVVGLCIAIPAIAYHHVIANRMHWLVREAGVATDRLMKRFAGVQPAAATAPVKKA